MYERVLKAVTSLPTIGPKTAEKLVTQFGEEMLANLLENNIQAFSNLMDDNGDFVFSDRQATRLDRALSKTEFSLGQGGYQPTEFIKRYLPKNDFGLMVVDEGHEYKNYGTAQGQAMGVLARCVRKVICLTGTLMGGYADDLFYLLWRLYPQAMLDDGFGYNKSGTLGTGAMQFMRQHGVLKDIIRTAGKEYDDGAFQSAKAQRTQVRTAKAPGFSPLGIMRYVLPITVFLKLKELGDDVLPAYEEIFRPVEMTEARKGRLSAYEQRITRSDEARLVHRRQYAHRAGDHHLAGVAGLLPHSGNGVLAQSAGNAVFCRCGFCGRRAVAQRSRYAGRGAGKPRSRPQMSCLLNLYRQPRHRHPSAKAVADGRYQSGGDARIGESR